MPRDREHFRTLSNAALLEEGRYHGITEEMAIVLAERLEASYPPSPYRETDRVNSRGGRYFFKAEAAVTFSRRSE